MNGKHENGRGGKTWILGGAVLLALLVVAGGTGALLWKDPRIRQVVEEAWAARKPADLDRPGHYDQGVFSFDYPGNWKITEKKSEGGVSQWLKIDTTAASSMQVALMKNEGFSEAQLVDNSLQGMFNNRVFDAPGDGEPFSNWGGLSGAGKTVKGKLLMVSDATVRIFSSVQQDQALLVVEMRIDSDEEVTAAGFDLVENSFDLKLRE